VVITTGRLAPADLGALPSNVHVEQYMPRAWLLADCDAIQFHAGSGTLQGAIDYGLPMNFWTQRVIVRPLKSMWRSVSMPAMRSVTAPNCSYCRTASKMMSAGSAGPPSRSSR
jgi:hypothetical protein